MHNVLTENYSVKIEEVNGELKVFAHRRRQELDKEGNKIVIQPLAYILGYNSLIMTASKS